MPPSAVDWLPGLLALVLGLVAGGLYVWRMRAAGAAPPATSAFPLERRDLLGKRDVLVRQLVELEDTAAKRSPEQLARERYALELETARVLQQLDRLAPAAALAATRRSATKSAPPASPRAAGRPALRGFLWGTGSMAALVGLALLVTQAARPRAPGGTPTGGTPTGGRPGESASPAPDPQEARLKAQVAQSPNDLAAHLALARLYLDRQDMMGVWNETQAVLTRSPGNPQALSYQALVRLAMGQADVARSMLQQAIAAEPDLIDAYPPLSLAELRLGHREEAARTMAEAKRRFPEQAEALTRLEAQFQTEGAEEASPEGNPHAAVPPPPEGAAPEAPATAVGEGATAAAADEGGRGRVAGQIELDPALQGRTAGGVLFLMVRAPGAEAGMPLAVERLTPTSFPLRFEIGDSNSMTGQPLPDQVQVEARLDSDGNPMTHPPTDPSARVDRVALGTSDLRLVLRQGQ
jgi:cytochrome c-type biogenesis protein CcmH